MKKDDAKPVIIVPRTPPLPSIKPDKEKVKVDPKIEKPLPATPKKK